MTPETASPRGLAGHWALLSAQLDDMLPLDAAARQQRLRAMRGHAPQLAAALDVALSAAVQADAQRFLEGSLAAAMPAPGLAGRCIAGHRLQARLGEGATASVWLATRAHRACAPGVALKLLHLWLREAPAAHRMRHEATVLAQLSHPGIAALLGAGETPQRQPFLLLEYVPGLPIDAHCDAHRLSVRARLQLALQVMQALAHVHDRGLVHCDVKPANILVTPQGQVKLLDFGIACPIGTPRLPSGAAQARPARLMTPGYAAPEQILGQPATPATDVYAVGLLLYALLCGGSPQALHTGWQHLLRSRLDQDARPMQQHLDRAGRQAQRTAHARGVPLALLRHQLGGELQALVARALRRCPTCRTPSMAALAAEVRHHLDLTATPSDPTTP